ncbi:hypothetical protein KFL_000600330 [Klebsormidium nitens]|uniref:Trichome birefringence-like C-terminal domain-containing protein n=1 Tax=Klebsormidium nitens TaxID=105231 RepID=A0A1Y1HW41_KLENI|nr:hypothetical protein KFL_000600330 [Klebsormidium nitens]|eukprot:GAQ80716.1 hypothetical protein KFL_000600330 [Klebsormidium nitens]
MCEKAAGKAHRGGDGSRSRHPPKSEPDVPSLTKMSPALWRALSRGFGDRTGTVPLVLALLVALSLFSSCFSEVQIEGAYSDYMQRVLSSIVTPPKVYPGLIKRHGVKFPRVSHAHGDGDLAEDDKGGFSREATVFGEERGVSGSAVRELSEAVREKIGIVQTVFNPAQGAFLVTANNSSLVEEVGSSGQLVSVGNLVLNLTNPSLINLTNPIILDPLVLPNPVNSSLAKHEGLSLVTLNLSSGLNVSRVTPPPVVLTSTGGKSSSKGMMPTPKFWPAAFYKPGSAAYDKRCDLGDGEWVLGPKRMNISNCPFASQTKERCAWRFAREPNYRDFRWQPRGCALPEFDASSFLHRWANKTILVAGDSLGRNFYGSFMCHLSHGGSLNLDANASAAAGFQIFRNEEHNITIGRAMSEFLVMKETSQEAFSRLNQIDRADPLWARLLPRADLLILNSGHWWMGGGKEKLFVLDGEYRPDLSWSRAFRIGMKHVRKAVERSGFNGTAIFRTFSPSHYQKGGWNSGGTCDATEPNPQLQLDPYVRNFLDLTRMVFANSTFQVMEISRLSAYRRDGHVGPIAGASATRGVQADCTHWCAEGVTDAWVDILQAMLRTE